MGLKVTWACDDCGVLVEAREIATPEFENIYGEDMLGLVIDELVPTGWEFKREGTRHLVKSLLCPTCAEKYNAMIEEKKRDARAKRRLRGEHGPA